MPIKLASCDKYPDFGVSSCWMTVFMDIVARDDCDEVIKRWVALSRKILERYDRTVLSLMAASNEGDYDEKKHAERIELIMSCIGNVESALARKDMATVAIEAACAEENCRGLRNTILFYGGKISE